uniref:ZP domain-containing protein n=1 Tax=Parastrongyloides trichosuri TaxID=131310 RepID=A0A0N4Z555_PARTI
MFCIFLFLLSSWIEITYSRGPSPHMVKKVECRHQFTVDFRANFTCEGNPFSPEKFDIYQSHATNMLDYGICATNISHINGSSVHVHYTGNAPSNNYKLSLKTTGECNGKTTSKYNDFDDDKVGCSPKEAKTQDFGIIAFP